MKHEDDAPWPKHGHPAINPGISSLPDEAFLLVFTNLSISDTVRCAGVCRSWRRILRSKACWAGIPLHLTFSDTKWEEEPATLQTELPSLVESFRCQLACGLVHTTELDIRLDDTYLRSSILTFFRKKAEPALPKLVHAFLRSLNAAPHRPLSLKSLKLANISPDQELCEALAPHCQHVETLHFTYSPTSICAKQLPSLRYVLEACPSLEEIILGVGWPLGFINQRHDVYTPLTEIAAFAQRRSRPYRCVRERPSHKFEWSPVDQTLLTPLLPWLGAVDFEVLLPVVFSTPFNVPVPGIHCQLFASVGPSESLSQHLRECQAARHAIMESPEQLYGELQNALSTPSVREVHGFNPTGHMLPNAYPNLLRFVHHNVSLEGLRTLSAACPNLSCLSVSLAHPDSRRTPPSHAFATFPHLTHLWLKARNSALASHIASTSRNLIKLTLGCPRRFDSFLNAAIALPFLTSLRIHPGHRFDSRVDGDWVHDECTGIQPTMCYRAASREAAVFTAGARLKHLHLEITFAAGLKTDFRPVRALLVTSSATLESLYLRVPLTTLMHQVAGLLVSGRFAGLRWAKIRASPVAIRQLSAKHPLCSWSSL